MNIIEQLLQNKHLDHATMSQVINDILSNQYSPEWVAGFLVALRAKGETSTELTAAVQVLQQMMQAVKLPIHLSNVVDVVGTGGDGHRTFNISTAAMLLAASCGAKVAKHGGKSVSSSSGSADCLQALGFNLAQTPEQIANMIATEGAGFMFAPNHHPGMRFVAGIRKQLGVRTIFNLLGPLANPAGVKRILLGVYHQKWLQPMAEVLREQQFEHAWLVCASNGLDEISSSVQTHVCELKHGKIEHFMFDPQVYGFKAHTLVDLTAEDAHHSASIIKSIFNHQRTHHWACRDMVVINAAVLLYLAQVCLDIHQGIALANQAIDSGKAWQTVLRLQALSQVSSIE